MKRWTHMILAIFLLHCVIAKAEDVDMEYSPKEFFMGFRALVLNGDKEKVAALLLYPLATEVGEIVDQSAFVNRYDEIITPQIVTVLQCATETSVEAHGWRGYTISRGTLWFDRVYYGSIIPNKEDPIEKYLADFDARKADTEHWYVRVYSIFSEPAACENLSD